MWEGSWLAVGSGRWWRMDAGGGRGGAEQGDRTARWCGQVIRPLS